MGAEQARNLRDELMARLASSPDVLLHNVDLVRNAMLLVQFDSVRYRAASFLDDRILGTDTPGGWLSVDRAAALLQGVANPRPLHFIFHAGHVGSTLLSRLLDACGPVLPLREPLALRSLADAADVLGHPESLVDESGFQRLQQLLLAAWSRGYADTAAVILKATSSSTRLAPRLFDAARAARAVCLALRAEPYLATLLGGANSLLDLRGHAPARIRRLNSQIQTPVGPLHALSPGEMAALGWVTESLTQAKLRQAHPERVRMLDFEDFLADIPGQLADIWRHYQLPGRPFAESPQIQATLAQYSKAPDRAYSPQQRLAQLSDARRSHATEISSGMRWLAELGRREPAVAAVLT